MITNDIGEEILTVAELIKELEKIEDKNAAVYIEGCDCLGAAHSVSSDGCGNVLIER